jgi:hypothetical protein
MSQLCLSRSFLGGLVVPVLRFEEVNAGVSLQPFLVPRLDGAEGFHLACDVVDSEDKEDCAEG